MSEKEIDRGTAVVCRTCRVRTHLSPNLLLGSSLRSINSVPSEDERRWAMERGLGGVARLLRLGSNTGSSGRLPSESSVSELHNSSRPSSESDKFRMTGYSSTPVGETCNMVL